MRRVSLAILFAAAATLLPAFARADASAGDDGASVLTRPPRGSLAAQLRLKLSLQMAGGVSLAATLDNNREQWRMLSPDQRERFREYVVSFLKKDAGDQERILKSYSAFLSLTKQKREAYRRRARWVQAVVATFTPDEREELRRMSSVDRAKALITRRDKLVREGKLVLDEPASAPARPAVPDKTDQ